MSNFWYNYSMDIPFIMFILTGIAIYAEKHKVVNYLIILNFIYVMIMRIFVWR